MLDLPKYCIVNKFIPKKTFYERVNIATSVKDEFVNTVDRITWLYKLSEDTLKVNKTENIEEIEIFEIDVKEKRMPKNVIKTISKSIPYKILFVIKYRSDVCYSIGVDNIYFSEWNENLLFDFKGYNLETIYQNIVKIIIKEETNNNSFDEVISTNNRKQELQNQISVLKNKIKVEKQFNRKVELNQQLRLLEQEMEVLSDEL